MINLKNVSKFYYSKGVIATGFTKVNLKFKIGEFVAITGESGSGKSTLLNVISGLDTYEEGEMYVEGRETSHYIEKDWENYRRKYIGNIYQNFNLINSYTVYQNVDLILSLNGISRKNRKKTILDLLKRVDMLSYKNTKVSKLSGGQKQRVAIARALAKDVPIIIADEPTGSLDKASATSIIQLLKEISKDKLIIIVTHNYDQVEDYVTRKIVMHDGRVLEDKKLKEIEDVDYSLEQYQYKNICFLEKLRLGFRNTFNILPKFLLLFIVYSFVVVALMGEYSFFKEGEYISSRSWYTNVFMDRDQHRIVFHKNDRSAFSEEEIDTIRKMDNVEHLVLNDFILDTEYSYEDANDGSWYGSLLRPLDMLIQDEQITGRVPEADNEVLLEGSKDDYQMYQADSLIGREYHFYDPAKGEIDKSKTYVVVGIRMKKDNEEYSEYTKLYVSNSVLEAMQYSAHQRYSSFTYDFYNEIIRFSGTPYYLRMVPNHWVEAGTVFVSEDEQYRCDKFNCVDKNITITAKNIYYEDTKTFRTAKVYNKKNVGWILDLPDYNSNRYDEEYNGVIYVNPEDYNSFFNKGTYQMSVFVKDLTKLDDVADALEAMNYHTLKLKDTLVEETISKIVRIAKIIVTLIFVVVLFFISYFIIKIILKSRNVYFSILRMLGSSRRVCLHLLMTELFVVSNLSYFVFLLLAESNKNGWIHVGFIDTINTYFLMNDYLVLYVIIVGMSFLLSLRYARKLFKDSVMNTYREEI